MTSDPPTSPLPALAAQLLCVAGGVAGTVAAQADGRPGPLLELTTTLPHVAAAIAAHLPAAAPAAADPVELRDGEVLALRFTSRGAIEQQARPGGAAPPVLHLRMRPAEIRARIKPRAGTFVGPFDVRLFQLLVFVYSAEPRYAARAVRALADFPLQIDALELDVRARADEPEGHRVDLRVVPRAGTWFHRVLAGIRPDPRGAHLLRTPAAAMSVAAAVTGPGLEELLAPLARTVADLRARTRAERADFRGLCAARIPHFDGSISLLADGPGRFLRLVGLRDPAPYAARSATEVARTFDGRRLGWFDARAGARLPAALAGSGLRMTTRDDDIFEAVTEAAQVELATFRGVVGSFGLKVRRPVDGVEVVRLVERIEKRWLRRSQLPEGALAIAELEFAPGDAGGQPAVVRALKHFARDLDDVVGQDEIDAWFARIPRHVEVVVHARGDGGPQLQVRARTRTRRR